MIRVGALLAVLALPSGPSAQAEPYAAARIDWTQVDVAVVPDTTGASWSGSCRRGSITRASNPTRMASAPEKADRRCC